MTLTFKKSGKQRMDEFKHKGIFSISDFERIGGRTESDINSSQFGSLLEILRIAAPFKMNGQTKYFLPCVLAHTRSQEKHLTDCVTVPSLIVSFDCGYCPKGVTGVLIKYLMTNEMKSTSDWILLTDEIYKNQISFNVGLYDTVVISILPTCFEITCISDPQFADEREDSSIQEICSEVREAIDTGIKLVLRDLNYINTHHSITFPCRAPGCKGSHPAKLLSKNGKHTLYCDRVRKRFKVPEKFHVWGIGKKTKDPDEPPSAVSSQNTLLTEKHHTILFKQLAKHSDKWEMIGIELGFSQSELNIIRESPLMLGSAPISWLKCVLTKWLQRAPEDEHGSINFATLENLKDALLRANLGAIAHDLHISLNN